MEEWMKYWLNRGSDSVIGGRMDGKVHLKQQSSIQKMSLKAHFYRGHVVNLDVFVTPTFIENSCLIYFQFSNSFSSSNKIGATIHI